MQLGSRPEIHLFGADRMLSRVPLPLLTSATRIGPSINWEDASLRLSYDFENNDGKVENCEIVFHEVIAFRFHQEVCVTEFLDIDYENLVISASSNWLNLVVGQWKEIVGWHEYQFKIGGSERFLHFSISFDDIGILELISSSYQFKNK
jgi:hypothetical protein